MEFLLRILLIPVWGIPVICSLAFFLPLKKALYKRLLLLICAGLLNVMIIFVGDALNLSLTIIFFIFCVLICCKGTFLTKLTISLMFASTAFSFNALLDNYISRLVSFPILPRMLFWGIVYLLLRHYAPEKDYSLSSSLWKLLLFLTCIPLTIVSTIVLLSSPYLAPRSDTEVINFILLFVSLLSFLGLIQTITVLSKQQKLEQKSAYMNINRHYYETLENQQFEVRRLKHDMANHLQTLSSLPDSEKDDYIANLLNTTAFTQTVSYCGDSVINAVLSSKKWEMEQRGITLDLKLDIASPLPFEKMDTCSIFANALDNAIEYCTNLPADERSIHLESHVRKGLFVFQIRNRCLDEKHLGKNTLPDTTKSNTKEHGFGLKSIREIVLRHSGHMEIQTENGEFILFLYIGVELKNS